MNLFIESSIRDSAALPMASGPPRLYPLAVSIGLTAHQRKSFTRIAELAYSHRNIKAMEQAARELLAFDTDAGLYYLAIAAKWQGRIEEARKLLESVRGPYQSRAIHALGAIHFESGRFDEAARVYTEAIQASQGCDVIALANFGFQSSAIKSTRGKHEQSLDDLLSLWPTIKVAAKQQPHLWPMLHSQIAYELLQLGRVEQAKEAVSVAIASPLADAYPIWQETAQEIAACERKAILVSVPARPRKIFKLPVVGQSVRQVLTKPTNRSAHVICSIIKRVATCAPIHAPPFAK